MRPFHVVPVLVSALLLTAAACGGGGGEGESGEEGASGPTLRVLFVGNSLIATNDLPGAVAELAERAGLGRIETETVAPGGVSLEEHWSSTGARERLEEGGWDAVVLQQGPSSLPASRAHLRRWAIRWGDLARSLGTRAALLTVWPETARASAFPVVVASYAAASRAAGALLLPAGDAWRRALAREADLGLYGSDGLHPSELGTALAALVAALGLTAAEPESLPSSLRLPGAEGEPTATVQLLRDAAAEALARSGG